MFVAVHVPKHHGCGAAEARFVGRPHHLEPLGAVDLVRAEDGSHFIVEDFRGRSRECREALGLEHGEVSLERQPKGFRPLPDFQGRKGVNVHLRRCAPYRTEDLPVRFPGVFRVDAPLQADLRGPPGPGFLHPPGDFFPGKIVGPASKVLRQFALGKGAELAFEIAHVGVIDIPVDHVAHRSSGVGVPQPVGALAHGGEVIAAGLKQGDDGAFAERLPGFCPGEEGLNLLPRLYVEAPQRLKILGRGRLRGPGGPGVGAGEACTIGHGQDPGGDLRV